MNSELNTDSIKLGSNTECGFFFRVTLKAEKVVRNASNMGIKIIDTTKGGGVRFTTRDLEKLNQSFCELQLDYEAGLNVQTNELIKLCSSSESALQHLSERLGILDVLTSFAVVAASSSTPYVRPELLEKGTNVLQLVECRHPVIEQAPNMQFIPNDIQLGNLKFVVLTGANMGGKSTYLRSSALAVLMAQIGCFVACSFAKFSLIDGIFTRVGAGDYQSKGISTFMAEMMDCTTIFETATENSLIIIDELGRGTSTYDGFGLAWAIAEEVIRRVKCFCLFATHFHELSKLKDVYSDIVENYKVETIIDENKKLTILHQIVPGVADRSFGINIAKLVGLPDSVIDDASSVLKIITKG